MREFHTRVFWVIYRSRTNAKRKQASKGRAEKSPAKNQPEPVKCEYRREKKITEGIGID
ncbi:unnamed protein product, partial [Larinioides sclopetarius]